mgnify:CR=1 FL=1
MKEFQLDNNVKLKINRVNDNVLRISRQVNGEYFDSALNRYEFLKEAKQAGLTSTEQDSQYYIDFNQHKLTVEKSSGLIELFNSDDKLLLSQKSVGNEANCSTSWFTAQKDEDWTGFGDQSRERLFHRGHQADLWVRNVKSYVPLPFFMSTLGYGIVVNTTHRIIFDMCAKTDDRFGWFDHSNEMDFYLIVGDDFKEILHGYCSLSGFPKLPPKWSFGLWYLARTQANDAEVLNDAMNFRREGIPLDVIGLEPGWMEKDYDYSTEKDWSESRFPIPFYMRNGPYNFVDAIKRMGFKLELWLCQQYDLTYEEERRIGHKSGENTDEATEFHVDSEVDLNFMTPTRMDKVTKPEEPWFEHLTKFVDQGADFFKQDGSLQVNGFPDRLYGNGMTDSELHNIYPIMYSRQMHQGFEKHTNRRGLSFTCSGWVGFQSWCGTWAGDTGGKVDTLCGMLNLSLAAHSWSTNDMEVTEPEGIHMGYFLPWAQINSWNYFRQPWLQGKKLLKLHKYYSRLRMQLMPYLYSYAYQATTTAVPMMRPLVLEFQNDLEVRTIQNQYLLGRDLMVVAFADKAYFPAGQWVDYWTGERVDGNGWQDISWADDRAGGLFLREGAIIPHGPLMDHTDEVATDHIDLMLVPSSKGSTFTLYEDDGVTLEHHQGANSNTTISTVSKGNTIEVTIAAARGAKSDMAANRTWAITLLTDIVVRSYSIVSGQIEIQAATPIPENGVVLVNKPDACIVYQT